MTENVHGKRASVRVGWQDDVKVDNIKSVGRAWTGLSGSGWGQIEDCSGSGSEPSGST